MATYSANKRGPGGTNGISNHFAAAHCNGHSFAKHCQSEFGNAPEIVTVMIKSCLKQIEPVDDEIVELVIKIKKGVLQNPEASGFWGMTNKEQDYETQIAA